MTKTMFGRLGVGVSMEVCVLAVLFEESGSGVVLVMEAASAIVPGWPGVTRIVTVAAASGARLPRSQLTMLLCSDRKSGVEGKSVDLGGRRIIKKKKSTSAWAGPWLLKLGR